MKDNRAFLLLMFIPLSLILANCRNVSNVDKLKGYWRSYYLNKIDFYDSFFINDSTISIKEYLRLRTVPLEFYNGKVLLRNNNFEWTDKYRIYKDKIIFNDSTIWIKYTETVDTKIEDLYSNLLIKIIPPINISNSLDLLKVIDSTFNTTIINIGEIKQSSLRPDKNEVFSTIQLNDRLAELNDIGSFLDFSSTRPYKKHALIINAHTMTPENFIDSVYNIGVKLYYKKNIYRTVLDTSNNNVVIKLKRIL